MHFAEIIIRRFLYVIVLFGAFSCTIVDNSPFGEDLERIDDALKMADEYDHAKDQKISTIENMLNSRGVNDLQKYHIYGQLFDEYEAYQFDKAKEMLERQEAIADDLGNLSLRNDALLDKAMLFINAGLYLETHDIFDQLDTNSFDQQQMVAWYNARQKFISDYDEYVSSSSVEVPDVKKVAYYQDQILKNTPESSSVNQHIRVLRLIGSKDFDKASKLNTSILAGMDPSSRDYAIRAYWQGTIEEQRGNAYEAIHWWSLSAVSDIRCAIKDNASLSTLASRLIVLQDTDRAFRYIRQSLDDAIFYNAKLRKVQIATTLPMIEKAYSDNRALQDREKRRYINSITTIALLLLIICLVAIRFYSKGQMNAREIKKKNDQLAEYYNSIEAAENDLKMTNLELIEANAAKEEYLGLFLSMCSGYLDKLKKTLPRDQYESELKNFYRTFDTSFVQLYPTFVEEFNSLLNEDDRIVLKEGENLNTELRIFALIKLGITQSSHIASLLRYSVNTIYNYRAQVKNAALSDRENFEDSVRKIGSRRL